MERNPDTTRDIGTVRIYDGYLDLCNILDVEPCIVAASLDLGLWDFRCQCSFCFCYRCLDHSDEIKRTHSSVTLWPNLCRLGKTFVPRDPRRRLVQGGRSDVMECGCRILRSPLAKLAPNLSLRLLVGAQNQNFPRHFVLLDYLVSPFMVQCLLTIPGWLRFWKAQIHQYPPQSV